MDERMGGFITCMLCGLIVGAAGVYMLASGNPRILHGYHYASVPPSKMVPLARWSGAGLLVAGVGCALLMPPAGMPDWMSVIGIALLIAGIGISLGAIVHFNGSLVTMGGSAQGTSRALMIGLGALAAVVVCAATVVPGALMIASGDPSMLHGYHLVNVDPADLPALAAWVGAGTIVFGVGLASSIGLAMCCTRRPMLRIVKILLVAALVLCGIGLVVMLGGIIHFNGSLMG